MRPTCGGCCTARVSGQHTGVAGGLPQLPRHAFGARLAAPAARRHGQRRYAEVGRQPGDRGNLLPVSRQCADRDQRCRRRKEHRGGFSAGERMPITGVDQQATPEAHDIVDADGTEPRVNLGRTDTFNRHAECTDCHNPHRAMKNALFNGTGAPTSAHAHASGHTNLASGALAAPGAWSRFTAARSFCRCQRLTRSSRASGRHRRNGTACDARVPGVPQVPFGLRLRRQRRLPDWYATEPRRFRRRHTAGTNNMQQYTNQAMEFQAPLGDQGAPGGNHRSWHPVMAPTGRTLRSRNMRHTVPSLRPGRRERVGTQTMYCSDCHGTNTAQGTVVPTGDGPGDRTGRTTTSSSRALESHGGSRTRRQCVSVATAARTMPDDRMARDRAVSRWRNDNLHTSSIARGCGAFDATGAMWPCRTAGRTRRSSSTSMTSGRRPDFRRGRKSQSTRPQTYNVGPYYMNAKLKIRNFATSGNWREAGLRFGHNQQGPDRSAGTGCATCARCRHDALVKNSPLCA